MFAKSNEMFFLLNKLDEIAFLFQRPSHTKSATLETAGALAHCLDLSATDLLRLAERSWAVAVGPEWDVALIGAEPQRAIGIEMGVAATLEQFRQGVSTR